MNRGLGRRHILLVFLCASVMVIGGCRSDGPHPLEDSLFVEVLADLLIADAFVSEGEIPAGAARDSVLQRHNVSADRFDVTLDHYASDPKGYLAIYDRVISRLQERRQFEERKSSSDAESDP